MTKLNNSKESQKEKNSLGKVCILESRNFEAAFFLLLTLVSLMRFPEFLWVRKTF
jgi:hypothetical protein